MAGLALIALALLGRPEQATPQAPRRWTEALREADALADDLARSRARVEVLYAAGDLPGALREGLAGLRAHAGDPALLTRTCELALALRIPEVATSSATALSAATPQNAPAGWREQSAALSAGARELRVRTGELVGAVRRAQIVSGVILLGVVLAGIGLRRSERGTD